MKKKQTFIKILLSCTLMLSLLFYIITVTNYSESKVLAKNNIMEKYKNDAIDQQKAIEKYALGDRSNVVRKQNGYDVIKVDNQELIILGDNFKGSVKPIYINHKHEKADIKYLGERTKPAIDLSNVHCNTSYEPITVTFQVSNKLSYSIEGSIGLSYSVFEAKLGSSINKEFTVTESRSEIIPARRCGTLRGVPKYDVYEYSGWIRKGTLYSPKGFIYFLALSPEE